ncbi:MAG: futalosine hydrolase [Chitinophagaceae bacterium]|nr:MAG: futalosine hydrolase [Chitinophagaceae bacterium]
MKILLCAATEMEISPTIQYLSRQNQKIVEVVVTGVGLMTSTYAITKAISLHQPDYLLQAGIAGTLHPAQKLGEVVAIRSEVIGDMGVLENNQFRSLFDLKLISSNLQPWTDGKLVNEDAKLLEVGLPLCDSVTVNEISTDEQTIRYYRDELKAQVESMEGAAFHYIALLERIPFLQLRSISNYIGERDKSKWDIKGAIANLNHELQRILTNYL